MGYVEVEGMVVGVENMFCVGVVCWIGGVRRRALEEGWSGGLEGLYSFGWVDGGSAFWLLGFSGDGRWRWSMDCADGRRMAVVSRAREEYLLGWQCQKQGDSRSVRCWRDGDPNG